ncbi:hypothetical protein F5146DRAFT_1120111 [Armillaria mellea]|nr:hypothetical protein F5146DRAFT_1120111 [Armillaria mellea]
MSQNYTYTIQSVQTGDYITSASDDHRNQNITTVDGTGATLTLNKALESGNNTDVTIKGISGLYAATSMRRIYPPEVDWSDKAENWQVVMTSPGVYVIIPKGSDGYWVTNGPMSRITLRAGKDVVDKENQWYIKKVD